MTYKDQETMIQIKDGGHFLINTFIGNACIETVIDGPDFIYNNVATHANGSGFIYLD